MTINEIKDEIVNNNKTLYFKEKGRDCSLAKDRVINGTWLSTYGNSRSIHHAWDDEIFKVKCFGGNSFTDLFGKVDYELK